MCKLEPSIHTLMHTSQSDKIYFDSNQRTNSMIFWPSQVLFLCIFMLAASIFMGLQGLDKGGPV